MSNNQSTATIQAARNGIPIGEPVDMDGPKEGVIAVISSIFNPSPPLYPDNQGPYVYIAHRRTCDCPLAVYPFGVDGKAAGVCLAEWVKSGWLISTASKKYGVEVGVCQCKPKEEKGEPSPLAYIGQRVCGCTDSMNVIPFDKQTAAGAGKIIQVWAGENKIIQTVPFDEVSINHTCPHVKPKERQAVLPGLGTAGNEGED